MTQLLDVDSDYRLLVRCERLGEGRHRRSCGTERLERFDDAESPAIVRVVLEDTGE